MPRARAIHEMMGEVVWANAEGTPDSELAYELAEGIATVGTTIVEIRESIDALAKFAGPLSRIATAAGSR